jgi:hypothetical protein
MTNSSSFQIAVGKLRALYQVDKETAIPLRDLLQPQSEVLARFQPVFDFDHLPNLQEEEFRAFLLHKNNHHWTGLHRLGGKICEDVPLLREALQILLDEGLPLSERFTGAVERVKGLGKAIASPILMVAYPDKYGVWNNTSEGAMRELEVFPDFERGTSTGEKYEAINRTLLRLADEVGVDLWTLDALFWWYLEKGEDVESEPLETDVESTQRFGLERHLHEFMVDNWQSLSLASDWEIFEQDGDPLAGREYPTDIGRIDILAKHKTQPEWLIVELKRDQTSDQTVGQVLRYKGFVQKHLANKGESVRGLIIAHRLDPKIGYALEAVQDVALMLYEVDFRLIEPE